MNVHVAVNVNVIVVVSVYAAHVNVEVNEEGGLAFGLAALLSDLPTRPAAS